MRRLMRKRLTLTAVVAALVACSAALVAAPHETRAAFPGQNGRIAFSADDGLPARADDVWAMDPDGTDLVNLTSEQPCCNGEPDWSPDGTKVAFESTRDGQSEIYVMDADGSDPVRLTNDPAWDLTPAWSPDGTKVAFTSSRDGQSIYVMNADGSDPVRITGGHSPAWSPDGKRMAFVGGARNPYEWCAGLGNGEIFVASADGSGTPERITRVAEGDPNCAAFGAHSPDWSPDGTKIAYSSGASYFGSTLYIIGADGSGERKLADIPSDESPSSTPDGDPSWSPDGSQIAFWGYGPSRNVLAPALFAVNADGSGAPRNLTNPQGCYSCQEFSAWAPDWGTAPPIAAPDTQAPKVISTFPRNGGEVGPTANIRASFSEEMQVASVKNAFKLFKKGSTNQIAAQVSYEASTDMATLNPTNNLRRGVTYKAVVSTLAKDVEGNRLDQNSSTAGLQKKVWFFDID
jgi:Tol biopolymer transport system component